MSQRALIPIALVSIAVAFGCRDGRVVTVEDGLVATPARIDFGEVFIGFPGRAQVSVTNGSRADVTVSARGPAPFQVTPETLVVPAGATVQLEVIFSPAEEGTAAGVLRIEASGVERRVDLRGVGRAAQVCEGADVCRPSRFDPAAGACVTAVADDGTSCGSAESCIDQGQCQAGTCVGSAPACDDGNPCTVDACEAGKGCVHLDGAAACPAPISPCQVPVCDPVLGCGVAPAADGTACGEADCVTANVCLNGTCQQVAVPDGAQCGDHSPCQAFGTCAQQVCVRPAPEPLKRLWSHSAGGAYIWFDGVADRFDNLYLGECATSCDLVSLTRDGVLRWRRPLTLVPGSVRRYPMMIAADALIVMYDDHMIQARALSDGALLWSRDLRADFAAQMFDADVPPHQRGVFFGRAAADPRGFLYLPLEARRVETTENGGEHPLLVSLDASTGALRWTAPLAGAFAHTAVDGAGNVLVSEDVQHLGLAHKSEVRSFTSTGALRFARPIFEHRDPVVFGGVVITGGYIATDTTTGTELWRRTQWPIHSSVMSGTSAWTLGLVSAESRYDLTRYDARTGNIAWTSGLGLHVYVGEPTLTETDTTLMLASHGSSPAPRKGILAVDARGKLTFSCRFPLPIELAVRLTVLRDRAVVLSHEEMQWRLVALDLPNHRPGAGGWVTERGDNTRCAAPR